jgi:hypothetical protein
MSYLISLMLVLTATPTWAGEAYIERHGDVYYERFKDGVGDVYYERHGDVTYVHPLPK